MKPAHSRILIVVGLVLPIVGALDPMEGSVVILGGSALAAAGAYFSHTKRFGMPLTAFVLIACGVGALFGLSAIGGVGGSSGRSIWWLMLCVPYPVGWVMGIAGAPARLRRRV